MAKVTFSINLEGDSEADLTAASVKFLNSVPPVIAADWLSDIIADATVMYKLKLAQMRGEA